VSVLSRGPHDSPGFWLHHAALTWRQACEARLGDITYPQFNVLSAVSLLAADGGPPTQQDVARFARMDRMMTSKLIRTLEGRGLLQRSPDPGDGRRWRLTLTPAGQSAVRACVAAAHRADDEVFGTGPDRNRLRDALRTIAENHGWVTG
jgi:DNA-binding MarR family transcriptional regulator